MKRSVARAEGVWAGDEQDLEGLCCRINSNSESDSGNLYWARSSTGLGASIGSGTWYGAEAWMQSTA